MLDACQRTSTDTHCTAIKLPTEQTPECTCVSGQYFPIEKLLLQEIWTG